MKNFVKYLLFTLAGLLFTFNVSAEKYKGDGGNKNVKQVKATAAGCFQSSGFKYIDINNVRTRVNAGGDMWWDFEKGEYEIPKGSGKTSMYSASLWIGGYDPAGNLKLAAVKFRQGSTGIVGSATDYWPGPLTIDGTAAVDAVTCAAWDKLFPITREEVDNFLAYRDDPASFPGYTIPKSIIDWPAHGDIDAGQSFYMAPFYDANFDGEYNPELGDFPYYDVQNNLCKKEIPTAEENEGIVTGSVLSDQVIKGDMTLWWVFNDKGNVHTESNGAPIGLEIRGQAFGFSTNDVINDMTFYSYEIINRSTTTLTETYFSQWVDTDLGYADDDFVGCDVERGLGYCYNGRNVDGTGQPFAYGENPPAIGVDFFQGPYMDTDGYDNPSYKKKGILGPNMDDCEIVSKNGQTISMTFGDDSTANFLVQSEAINGINFGDGIVDNERYGMRRFVYHNNGGAEYMSDPSNAPQYYSYLIGVWKDGSKMVYGGNGNTSPGSGGYGPETDFMFPSLSDPCFWGTKGEIPVPPPGISLDWTEQSANNAPDDRRFMQSAGPFTLEPGAVNYITVGIPWARANAGGAWASVQLLQQADDVCQNLFDNCFQVINGPNAPDVTIRELDKTIILYLSNRKTADAGNNYKEQYSEYDFNIVPPDTLDANNRWDTTYNFEGYQVFQLLTETVSVAELYDPARARLIYQCDVKNNVSRLINFESDQSLGSLAPTEKVNGNNIGIANSIELSQDAFTGENLINNTQYHYLAISYAHNEYYSYTADPSAQNPGINDLYGQKLPYLAGRKNIKVYTGIPHKTVGKIKANADYGDGIKITRIEGQGNGGNVINLTDATITEILSKEPANETNVYGDETYPIAYKAEYEAGFTPVQVKVIDPLNIKAGEFVLKFDTLVHSTVTDFTGTIGIEGDTLPTEICKWKIEEVATGNIYYSDTTISTEKEQIFLDLGISIVATQSFGPGYYNVGRVPDVTDPTQDIEITVPARDDEGYLESTFEFQDPTKQWLTGLKDVDGVINDDNGNYYHRNWIRSGSLFADGDTSDTQYDTGTEDENQIYENLLYDQGAPDGGILNSTWAPYVMTARESKVKGDFDLPICIENGLNLSYKFSTLRELNSVDVVLTADQSKWTRTVVMEMGRDIDSTEGGAELFYKRLGKSVNINGETDVESSDPTLNSYYIDSIGMGWFPGYAVDIETGERLNIIFGEDSRFINDNGRDMLWNPSSREFDENGTAVVGGKHAIYIFRSAIDVHNSLFEDTTYRVQTGPYDAGAEFNKYIGEDAFKMQTGVNYPNPFALPRGWIFGSATWVGVPMAVEGLNLLDNDLKLRFRVTRPYARFSGINSDTAIANENGHYPMYNFNTDEVIQSEDIEKASSDLDIITVVPNPYYGYSSYEINQLDNRVKITNLPEECTVTIYGLNGNLLRQFKKSDPVTFIEWDLKNFSGIPISGGMYYIHIDAGDVGEKIVKFYAVMRPVDLNAF